MTASGSPNIKKSPLNTSIQYSKVVLMTVPKPKTMEPGKAFLILLIRLTSDKSDGREIRTPTKPGFFFCNDPTIEVASSLMASPSITLTFMPFFSSTAAEYRRSMGGPGCCSRLMWSNSSLNKDALGLVPRPPAISLNEMCPGISGGFTNTASMRYPSRQYGLYDVRQIFWLWLKRYWVLYTWKKRLMGNRSMGPAFKSLQEGQDKADVSISRILIFRAGTPTTIEYGSTSAVTTAPAPTIAPSPMETPGNMDELAPIHAFLPIFTDFNTMVSRLSVYLWSVVAMTARHPMCTPSPMVMPPASSSMTPVLMNTWSPISVFFP